ncbi:hypothetical protein Tco_0017403 [Tanacetum coccineum]
MTPIEFLQILIEPCLGGRCEYFDYETVGITSYGYCLKIVSSSWSLVLVVLGVPVGPVFLLGLLALAIDAACAFRAEEMPSLISCWMAANFYGIGGSDVGRSFGRHSIHKITLVRMIS